MARLCSLLLVRLTPSSDDIIMATTISHFAFAIGRARLLCAACVVDVSGYLSWLGRHENVWMLRFLHCRRYA